MKTLLFLLISFLLPQLAAARPFLTYSEFQALKSDQQIQYISSVKQLVVSLEKDAHLYSEMNGGPHSYTRMLAALVNQAEASELERLCDVKSVAHLNTDNFLSRIEQFMWCVEKTGPKGRNIFLPMAPRSAVVLSNEYRNRLEKGTLKRNSRRVQEANGIFSAVVSGVRKDGVYGGGGDYTSELQTISENIEVTERIFVSGVAPRVRSTAVEAVPTARTAMPAPEIKSAVIDQTLICLYAGFVISKNDKSSCKPLSQLPKSWSSNFFNRDEFQCSASVPVMCNPLLFGYEPECKNEEKKPCQKKLPLCISRSASATRDCQLLAEQKNSFENVAEIWKSQSGEALYKEFVSQLESLCDADALEARKIQRKAKKDIADTCKVAFEVFEDQVERKFLPTSIRGSKASGQK